MTTFKRNLPHQFVEKIKGMQDNSLSLSTRWAKVGEFPLSLDIELNLVDQNAPVHDSVNDVKPETNQQPVAEYKPGPGVYL